MIPAADAALAARDPSLPGLRTLLDAEAFAAALSEHEPTAGITGARPTYVRYKRGTSCLAAFEVATRSGPALVYARTQRPDDRDKLRKVRRRAAPAPTLGLDGLLLDERHIAVYAYPNDRRLPVLRTLADAERRSRLLARLVPDLAAGELELLRYKPERRLVARVHAGGRSAIVRLLEPARARRPRRAARALALNGAFRTPALLAASSRRGLSVFEWLDGRPLDVALAAGWPGDAELRAVGRALAALHAVRPSGELRARDEASALRAAADAVGALVPAAPVDPRALAATLAARLGEAPCQAALHGDFSCDQVLLRAGGPALLDLDHARRGDPATDLGSFAGDLELRVLAGELPGERAVAAVASLADGYRAGGGSPVVVARGLGPWAAAALLVRAVEPFRLREPDWEHLSARCLIRAAERAARPCRIAGGRRAAAAAR
jgi:aminoglycoside phosphotransferase (APT) family kinase protein